MTALSNANPELRRYWSSLGGKARAAKLTPEQRQAISKAAKARVARLTPEQIREFNSKSSRAYWTRMTAEQRSEAVRARVQVRSPEVRRSSARKAAEHRWAQPAYATHQKDADRLYAFLEEQISAKHYAPTVKELSRALGHEPWFTKRLLRILQRIGRIQRHHWAVGITLTSPAPVSSQVSSQIGLSGTAVRLVPERKAFKACIECANPAVDGRTRCERHLVLASEGRARKRANGVCLQCSAPAVAGKTLCELHLGQNRERARRHYANKCCGERAATSRCSKIPVDARGASDCF